MKLDSALALKPVQIFQIRLDQTEAEVFAYRQWLSLAEQERAAKFLSANKTREFTITRGTLKMILAEILDEDISQVSITHEKNGRPCLASNKYDTRFSVSHSCDRAMIAVTRGREIGIDLEKIRADIDHDKLSRRYFSPAEYAALQLCDESTRLRAFFAVWTRKEAIVKAHGKGIALGLNQFDVSVDPDQPPRLLTTRWQYTDMPDWTLLNLDAAPEYFASMAVSGGAVSVVYRDLP